MWFWLISSIAGSIIGSATESWFRDTKVGVWFQKHVDNLMAWVAHRYDLEILSREDKWLSQYPGLAKRIVDLEKEVKKLKSKKA